jgi:S-adenosylmethionine decarboxylase
MTASVGFTRAWNTAHPSSFRVELLHQDAPPSRQTQTQQLSPSRSGVPAAGVHLILDLFSATHLADMEVVETTLRRCVDAAGATLLHIHFHRFEPNDGISGVAVLAESHISIHTWPEAEYAALDIFMCGQARPERCIEILLEAFKPQRAVMEQILRGRAS